MYMIIVKLSSHDAFQEQPSSGTLKATIFESPNNSKIFRSKKTKGLKENSYNLQRPTMPEGGVR